MLTILIIFILLSLSIDGYSQTESERKKDSIATYINALDEITVERKKEIYVQKPDRMIFNVENSIVSEGGTALDVLARAPGVVVSQDGELSVRGQKGVSVMIDGKLTQLSQKELGNYLKSTTSSNIKQIEVITNPSSKYDAAGKAGIINIVLKKSRASGLKGTVFSNYGRGRKDRTNSGLNLNYNKNKIGFFGNYSYSFRGEEEYRNFNQIQYKDISKQEVLTINNQHSVTDEPLSSNNFKIGTQYEVSPKTNLEIYVDAKTGQYKNIANGQNILLDEFNQDLFNASIYNNNKEKWRSYTYSFSGIHKFDTEGKNMIFDRSSIKCR